MFGYKTHSDIEASVWHLAAVRVDGTLTQVGFEAQENTTLRISGSSAVLRTVDGCQLDFEIHVDGDRSEATLSTSETVQPELCSAAGAEEFGVPVAEALSQIDYFVAYEVESPSELGLALWHGDEIVAFMSSTGSP